MRRRDFIIALAGAMGGWPSAMCAQKKATPVIGYLGTTVPGPYLAVYRQGLSEMGYAEGQNVAIEYRWAGGHYDRLPALAADLVSRKVDLIAAFGGIASVRAAKDATSSIPITFLIGIDPVVTGLVASLARPGGNLTGISILAEALYAKRLELLTELVPQVRVVTLLVSPNDMNTQGVIRVTREAASARGVQLRVLNANSDTEIDGAFGILVQRHAEPSFRLANKQL